jgi:5-methylcytosine-specific restriction endonuclease McrA
VKTCTKCGEEKALDAFGRHVVRGVVRVYPSCKPCAAERARRWREANKDLVRERNRHYSATYFQRHKQERMDYVRYRRATKEAPGAQPIVKAEVYARDGGRCRECGCEAPPDWHLDHIVPVKLGGTHTWENVRVLCPPCNFSKGARLEGQITLPVG